MELLDERADTIPLRIVGLVVIQLCEWDGDYHVSMVLSKGDRTTRMDTRITIQSFMQKVRKMDTSWLQCESSTRSEKVKKEKSDIAS